MQPSTSSDLANRSKSTNGPHALLVGAVALLLAIAYADTFKWLWNYWIEGYNWQFLVPVAFVYMLRERRDLYSGLTQRPNLPLGFVLLAGGCALLIAGQVSSTNALRELSIVVNVFALTFLFFGTRYVRALFWPLAYLGLMLSFPQELLGALREPLKLLSATVSAHALQAAGFVVHRDGAFLQLPHITLEVADSCSGLNQLVSSIALGIPLAFTMLNRLWERVLIVVLSVFMGIAMNWVRVVLIAIWHYGSAKTEVHGPHGIYELPFIFLVGVVVTISVASWMSRRSPAPARAGATRTPASPGAAHPVSGSNSGVRRYAPAIVAMLLLGPVALYLATWKSEPAPLKEGFATFPMKIAGFSGQRIAQLGAPFRHGVAQEEFLARYANESGVVARVLVGYFPFQNEQHELIDFRFNWLHERARLSGAESGPAMGMKVTPVTSRERTSTAYFYYDINGKRLVDPKRVKLASLIDALTTRRTNGAIVIVLFDGDAETLSPDQRDFLEGVATAADRILAAG
jgi:exosortase